MPRVKSRADVHEVYSPKSRAQQFPEVDFRFLVHVAANISRAVALVHKHGHVIGDINHGSVLVSNDGTAVLIDCDSMQISSGGRSYACDMGVDVFTPPELQGKSFRGLVRTANHDAFGLAVLLFYLLFMGRHPFAGRYLGRGDMPIEQAIREFRFAYGSDRQATQMEAPPFTVPIKAMGASIAARFEEAFGRQGIARRPTALQWIGELESLARSLKQCAADSTHFHNANAGGCPWCPIEQAAYVRLFGERISPTVPGGTVSVRELWAAICAVNGPGPLPDLPVTITTHKSLQSRIRRIWVGIRKVASFAVACAGIVGCAAARKGDGGLFWFIAGMIAAVFVWPRPSSAAKSAFEDADRKWKAARSDWENHGGDNRFRDRRRELEALKNELANLPDERTRRLQALNQEREKLQRSAYLDRFRLDRAEIPLIGEARVAMLASYGVETAADVDYRKVDGIPGFGQRLTKNLLAWRREHEKNFRFNSKEAIDPKVIAAMERDLNAKQVKLANELRGGPLQLRQIEVEVQRARSQLRPRLEEAWNTRSIAEDEMRV